MVPHVRRIVDEDFFKQWTPKMAWVLGVIYTDGCLVRPHGSVKGRLALSQKKPELIEKVLTLLSSNAKLLFTPKKGITGAVHRVSISNYDQWLDPTFQHIEPLNALLRPYPSEELTAYSVSTLVNNPRHDVPQCLEPVSV